MSWFPVMFDKYGNVIDMHPTYPGTNIIITESGAESDIGGAVLNGAQIDESGNLNVNAPKKPEEKKSISVIVIGVAVVIIVGVIAWVYKKF